MTIIMTVCDECGSNKNVWWYEAMTGRVLIDGKDNNRQGCDLCEEHMPLKGKHQPNNCKRVRFYWSGMDDWNNE